MKRVHKSVNICEFKCKNFVYRPQTINYISLNATTIHIPKRKKGKKNEFFAVEYSIEVRGNSWKKTTRPRLICRMPVVIWNINFKKIFGSSITLRLFHDNLPRLQLFSVQKEIPFQFQNFRNEKNRF